MNIIFDETKATPLCDIMGRNRSDKGSINILKSWHNYTTFYYTYFKDIQYKSLRIFELGLGTNNTLLPSNMGADGIPGASLYAWAEFFENSEIFGADIDKDILFNNSRIQTYYCDQTNPDIIKKMWDEPALNDKFDFILDDGLHTFKANWCFFENSIHKLTRDGIYIIEDILNNEIPLFYDIINNEAKLKYPQLSFSLLKIPSVVNKFDNNLIIIKYNN